MTAPIELLAFNWSWVVVHPRFPAAAIFAVGALPSCAMVICAVSVQPLLPVTVKVYVPAALINGEFVFAPNTIFPLVVVH